MTHRDSPPYEELVKWVSSFEYPHCSEVTTLNDLKTGVALCELIYEIVLNREQPKLLQQVIISQVGRKQSISNLTLALQHIRRAGQMLPLPTSLEKLTAEQLYEHSNKLKLLLEYLRQYSQTVTQTDAGGKYELQRTSSLSKRPPLPRQNKSASRNQLYASTHKQQQPTHKLDESASFMSSGSNFVRRKLQDPPSEFIRSASKRSALGDESPIKYNIEDPVSPRTKTNLLCWLCDIHLIKMHPNLEVELPSICKNGAIFIDLLNWISGKEVVLAHTANSKQTDKQNAETVYQRVLKYLSKFERMNPRYLLSARELADGNQDLFWGLLDDIYHWHLNKISRFDRRYWRLEGSLRKSQSKEHCEEIVTRKRSETQQVTRASKPGSIGNCLEGDKLSNQRASTKQLATQSSRAHLQKDQPNKENVRSNHNLPLDDDEVQQIYRWVRRLGFSYSLEKSLKLPQDEPALLDPLRNGTLVGSLVVRLQICKLNIIKSPECDKHVMHNFEEINRNCLRRALGLTAINPPFSKGSILMFLQKLMQLDLQPRLSRKHQLEDVSKIRQIPLQLKEWLDELNVNDVRREFSRIATSVLRVDYCKETTDKIRQLNITKVLNYLKKIGMVQYLPVTFKDVLNEDSDVVWQLMQDIYALKFSQ